MQLHLLDVPTWLLAAAALCLVALAVVGCRALAVAFRPRRHRTEADTSPGGSPPVRAQDADVLNPNRLVTAVTKEYHRRRGQVPNHGIPAAGFPVAPDHLDDSPQHPGGGAAAANGEDQ